LVERCAFAGAAFWCIGCAMSLRVHHLRSTEQLRRVAEAWDDLWQRSDVASPLARAEAIALWIEHFAPAARIDCLAIEDQGHLVAALPLVGMRLRGLLPVAGLPANPWSVNGDLLLDPQCDPVVVLGRLLEAWSHLAWPLAWLNGVSLDSVRWRLLVEAANQLGLWCHAHQYYRVGVLDWPHSGDPLEGRSRSLRRNVRRYEGRLRQLGRLSMRCAPPAALGDELLQQVEAVERRSWKYLAGTALVQSKAAQAFFRALLGCVAAWGQASIAVLLLDDDPLAFQFGYLAKGTYLAHKASYDLRFAPFSPGHLMLWYRLRSLAGEGPVHRVDFMGPLNAAIEPWASESYSLGRLVLASGRSHGTLAAWGYRTLRPLWQWLRGSADSVPTPSRGHRRA
jgi:CelD/BcsL family acetyltransferase involved in cellulose biosynthesis